MTTTINAKSTGIGGLDVTCDASGSLGLQTGGVTAVTINTSQNVGIGTTSPSGKFHVANANTAGTSADNLGVYFSSINRNCDVYIQAKNTEGSKLNFGDGDNASVGRISYEHSTNHMAFDINAAERMRIDSSGNLLFNSGYGSVATAYGCRAWVNFNGTGTVAIRSSGNVSSITDNGTGDYTVNFTTAMPDANYSVGLSVREDTGGVSAAGAYNQIFRTSAAISTSSVRVFFANGSTKYDVDTYCVQIFR